MCCGPRSPHKQRWRGTDERGDISTISGLVPETSETCIGRSEALSRPSLSSRPSRLHLSKASHQSDRDDGLRWHHNAQNVHRGLVSLRRALTRHQQLPGTRTILSTPPKVYTASNVADIAVPWPSLTRYGSSDRHPTPSRVSSQGEHSGSCSSAHLIRFSIINCNINTPHMGRCRTDKLCSFARMPPEVRRASTCWLLSTATASRSSRYEIVGQEAEREISVPTSR